MRAMFAVTANLLICTSLCGCNRNTQAQAPVPAPVVAAAPACNCPQQGAAAVPAVISHRHRHHYRAWSEHESSSYPESHSWGDESASSYSGSSSETDEDNAPAESGSSSDEVQARAAVWVDGYGRSHYEGASASDDTGPAALTAADINRRHAPWHAYNSDCDRTR